MPFATKKKPKPTETAPAALPQMSDFPSYMCEVRKLEELQAELVAIDLRAAELQSSLLETDQTREVRERIRTAEAELTRVSNDITKFERKYFEAGNRESRRLHELTPAQKALAPEHQELQTRRRNAEQTIRLGKAELHRALNVKRPSIEALLIINPAEAERRMAAETELAELASRRRGFAEAIELQRPAVEAARRAAARQMTVELQPLQNEHVRELAEAAEKFLAAADALARFNSLAAQSGASLAGVCIPQLELLRQIIPQWVNEQRTAGRLG